jgi:hypothetical protein
MQAGDDGPRHCPCRWSYCYRLEDADGDEHAAGHTEPDANRSTAAAVRWGLQR